MAHVKAGTAARIAELRREVRQLLGEDGPFRLRVALDIAEIECAIELDRAKQATPLGTRVLETVTKVP